MGDIGFDGGEVLITIVGRGVPPPPPPRTCFSTMGNPYPFCKNKLLQKRFWPVTENKFSWKKNVNWLSHNQLLAIIKRSALLT